MQHYRYRLSLYDVAHYFQSELDEASTRTVSVMVLDPRSMIEGHLRLLLLNELYEENDLRLGLREHLPSEVADPIGDGVHDMILMEIRPYLSLDDDQEVTAVTMFANYDVEVLVHERPWVNAVLPD